MNTKATRRQIHALPSPEIQAALGRVAARHGFLDHVLIRTIKTLRRLTIQEADRAYAKCGSGRLRGLVGKHAVEGLGEGAHALSALRALLEEAEGVTERRNVAMHCLWARDMDSEETMLIDAGSAFSPPRRPSSITWLRRSSPSRTRSITLGLRVSHIRQSPRARRLKGLAPPDPPEQRQRVLARPVSFTRALGKWGLEVTQPPLDGQVIWYIGYKSKEECEAAMPTSALAAWWLGMSDARCTDSTGGFLGSRNTDQSKN